MSRMLKPVLAGLAISSLCLSFPAADFAQNAAKTKQPIKKVQAEETRPRQTPKADDDDDYVDEPTIPAGKPTKQARPAPLPTVRIPKLSPELEKVLKDWELRTSKIKSMSGSFTRFKYDFTFEVVKQAEGNFNYEAPDKGNYELRGVKVAAGQIQKVKNIPMAVKSDEPERWVCTGKEVIRIDDKAKTYEKVIIPPESQGQNIIDGPLPFLFGMKADRAKQRYRDFKLLRNDETEIRLELRSFDKTDTRNWDKAIIQIDPKTFSPKAVKLIDTTGAESVHVFKDIVTNKGPGIFDKDPFKPNLRSYKEVMQDRDPAAVTNEKPIAPGATKQSKATPATGRSTTAGDLDNLGRAPDTKTSAANKKATGAGRN